MNMGVILAHFQSVGNTPVEMDKLKSFTRLGAIKAAVDFNLNALCCEEALCVFFCYIFACIFISVQFVRSKSVSTQNSVTLHRAFGRWCLTTRVPLRVNSVLANRLWAEEYRSLSL